MRSGHQYSSTVISRPHPHPLGGKGLWRCFLELITRFLITVLAELAHLAAHGANEKAMVVTGEQFSFLSFSLGGGVLAGEVISDINRHAGWAQRQPGIRWQDAI